MGKMQVRQEARALQGTSLKCQGRTLRIAGGSSQAEFEMGSEGLVHLATDESSGEKVRIKCFWEPDERRHRRTEKLVELDLPDLQKSKADALGGAPFGMLPALGPFTPFAVVMKNVYGESWRKLRSRVEVESTYPPPWWPPSEIRATWGYGLATAVMKMEARGFIHADLSPGNVVVNEGIHGIRDEGGHGEEEAGDMALVDFDRYVHAASDMPEPGQGSPGYAAPEIWGSQALSIGSDRVALAILIQEFLVTGDPDVSREESLDWSYDQQARCFQWSFATEHKQPGDDAPTSHGSVHALLARKYPVVAKLVRETLAAASLARRPNPEAWRRALRDIVDGTQRENKARLRSLHLESYPIKIPGLQVAFGLSKASLDLSITPFEIRATLERDSGGCIFVIVQQGATLNVRAAGKETWTMHAEGSRLSAEVGMVLSDKMGKSIARIESSRCEWGNQFSDLGSATKRWDSSNDAPTFK